MFSFTGERVQPVVFKLHKVAQCNTIKHETQNVKCHVGLESQDIMGFSEVEKTLCCIKLVREMKNKKRINSLRREWGESASFSFIQAER